MAVTLTATLGVDIAVKRTDAGTLNTVIESLVTGVSGFDSISKSLTTGTGSGQANKVWYDERSILTTANDDLDLTALTDRHGVALSITLVKWVVIVIDTPAAGKYLVFKGSTATNPVALWKASAIADENIHDVLVRTNNVDGWAAVNGATDVIRLHNPGLTTMTYRILILGS